MLNLRLYMAQRLSALVMVPLTIGHILVMVYAVQGGLSVGEILERTQGSVSWFLFYGSFVLAVSVHAAIGIRVIGFEWGGLRGWVLDGLSWLVFGLLLWLGSKAVFAVTLAGVEL
jgi:fumarate reductase subunit C